ncbi:MAG: hypothetical protein JKY83_06130 [Rhizobiaceae bacterium]|nr:hypothetical protein [Rhizobiaceae bacterium]
MAENVNLSKPRSAVFVGLFAILFGALTLYSGGAVLFFDGQARVDAGDYVPFVLWFNFFSGFAYIVAGVGLYMWDNWATKLAEIILATTLLVFAAFAIHILIGGDYEIRTLAAMMLRSSVWLAIVIFCPRPTSAFS